MKTFKFSYQSSSNKKFIESFPGMKLLKFLRIESQCNVKKRREVAEVLQKEKITGMTLKRGIRLTSSESDSYWNVFRNTKT